MDVVAFFKDWKGSRQTEKHTYAKNFAVLLVQQESGSVIMFGKVPTENAQFWKMKKLD